MISFGPRPVFDGFGAWTLAPELAWPQADILLNGDARQSRKLIRREAPCAPGVYGMVDREGELIYVGQSKSLRDRLLSHLAGSAPPKARQIIAHTRRLLWEIAPDEFAAPLRELELIRRWRPRFNVQGQPNRRRPTYLILGRGPVPYIYLAGSASRSDTEVFGPVRASRECRRAIDVLNDYFQLRVCGQRVAMRLADQQEIFPSDIAAPCLRHDLGNCLAPCAAGCSSRQYADRVRAVRRFLCGRDRSALAALDEAMTTAAAAQRYEQAAVFRTQRELLADLYDELQRFRRAQRDYNFIYPLPGREGRCSWYFIRRGQVHLALEEPRGHAAAKECLEAIEQIYTGGATRAADAMREDVEMTLLVASWFRSRPEELKRTVSSESLRLSLVGLCWFSENWKVGRCELVG